MAKFEKGNPGKAKGTLNKTTAFFRDAILKVYGDIGGHENFAVWAKANETEFYKIAARLIPTEVHATINDNRSVAEYSDADLIAILASGNSRKAAPAQDGTGKPH